MSAAKKPASAPPDDGPKIRLGVSSCLLGEEVRFDGGHKHDSLLTGLLGRYVEWVPVCPEVELGLGTPRESLRLTGSGAHPRMMTVRSGVDHTDAMNAYAARRVDRLAGVELHGYVVKKDSPSCGMERVKVYGRGGVPTKTGRGLYTAALMRRFPALPVEEEGRLNDAALRENFVERIFCRHRWLRLLAGRPRPADLVAFHTRHKMTLLAHDEPGYRRMGRLVAAAGSTPMPQLLQRYEEAFTTCLQTLATRRKQANVLYHLLGFLKRDLSAGDTQELVGCIEDYRRQLVPLIVPVTLLKHHFRGHPLAWVEEQVYLNPYPAELMLRNCV